MPILKDIPDGLYKAICDDRCALYAGAGLSMRAGYPSWSGLLSLLIEKATSDTIISEEKAKELNELAKKKFLLVAQELSDDFGREVFLSEIVNILSVYTRKPTEAHNMLPTIPFSLVITTNYDQLIENAYAKVKGEIPSTYNYQDVSDFSDALWRKNFFILKAHGDISRRSTMILTRKDYRSIIHASAGYRAVLSAIFTTKTVLFLGVSLTDPETELLLSYLHAAFHGSGQYHYAFVPESGFSETVASRWRRDYKVYCIRYTPTDEHIEVIQFLEQIQEKCSVVSDRE